MKKSVVISIGIILNLYAHFRKIVIYNIQTFIRGNGF
jgi:hypothetical protein